MMAPHAGLERRVLAALEAAPPRIPVVIGGCGTGRTTLLHGLADRMGRDQCQYIDVERAASTPERFQQAVSHASPFRINGQSAATTEPATSARAAFDRTLALLTRARASGDGPSTFLLDEVLELRTFESFPGLRHVLRELLHAMAESSNRFVLTSRYVARAHRLLRDGDPRFEVIHLPQLDAAEVAAMLPPMGETAPGDREYLGRAIQALADGRAAYVRALGEATGSISGRGGDPISALTALLTGEGALAAWCSHRYELRLHKARGYGALKAILEILAEEEPLTLTEVAQRLHRTPGSTKDYLSWLEDVDLIVSRQKRYSFADPLTRLWVRLHCRPVPPSVDEVAREVQSYAMARLPHSEPALEMAGAGAGATRKDSGLIEID
ncbi:MAG TPA: winged helix-turn-helix transcriptional regulator [Vicinamibacterales bacterium]|nr:winged helix-turn-helix transcriptional regulator [Vicinamibacterales bacterium]